MTTPSTTIPEGYKADSLGRLVPIESIKAVDLARDELVIALAQRAEELSTLLADFRHRAFADIAAFVDLSAERYGAKLGGVKGNISLVSFDGQYRIQRAINDVLVFDERLQAAKALIDQCILKWSEGSRSEIRTLIADAFNVDKEGNINTNRILQLRRLEISDPQWKAAMDAINESLSVACSRSYIRVHKRNPETGKYDQIGLDLASAKTGKGVTA